MTTRAYDYILEVTDTTDFEVGNVIIGTSSSATAEIVDIADSSLKVRLKDLTQEFINSETIFSNTYILNSFVGSRFSTLSSSGNSFTLSGFASGYVDALEVLVDGEYIQPNRYVVDSNVLTFKPILQDDGTFSIFPETGSEVQVTESIGNTDRNIFVAANIESEVTTATSEITSISSAPYIAEKNSQEQTPIVKMYTIYYPGEWYPPTANGNPNSGYAWPYGFPKRYAEVAGETYGDFNYVVSQGNVDFTVNALESGDISVDASGRIGQTNLQLANFDGVIAALVENPNIVGYSDNATSALVNGESVNNIDPRTVSSNAHYDAGVAASRGANASMDYETTIARGETWIPIVPDSRDLLGAVVELRLTYAKFLDYWPEYSIVTSSTSNSATMRSSAPYRIGDAVTSNSSSSQTTVSNIIGNTVYFSSTNLSNIPTDHQLLIINPDADSKAFVEHKFRIDRLDEMNEFIAKFSLTNWTQFFKLVLPKRRYYRDKCPWKYKGVECQYPIDGTGIISGTAPPISANGFFTANNVSTSNISEDVCAKTYRACSLRNNTKHFGGFPGVKK